MFSEMCISNALPQKPGNKMPCLTAGIRETEDITEQKGQALGLFDIAQLHANVLKVLGQHLCFVFQKTAKEIKMLILGNKGFRMIIFQYSPSDLTCC